MPPMYTSYPYQSTLATTSLHFSTPTSLGKIRPTDFLTMKFPFPGTGKGKKFSNTANYRCSEIQIWEYAQIFNLIWQNAETVQGLEPSVRQIFHLFSSVSK